MTQTTQTSIADYVKERRDKFIADWADWRNCQFDNDDNKELVDSVYSIIIHNLSLLISTYEQLDIVDPDDIPF